MICRKYEQMNNPLGIIELGNADYPVSVVFDQPKCNRMWGADYLFMDGNSFLGGIEGAGYAQMIDILQKIWDGQNYRLFSEF